MRFYYKNELAQAAGVSRDTLRKWLKSDAEYLAANNVSYNAKLLPPHVVLYLCKKYCIDLPK